LFAGALLLSPGSRNLRGRSGTRRLEDLFPRAERSHVEGAGVRRPTALIRPRTRRQRLHTNAITLPAAWTVPSSCRRSRKLRRSEQRTATRARPQAQRRLTWLAWELSLLSACLEVQLYLMKLRPGVRVARDKDLDKMAS